MNEGSLGPELHDLNDKIPNLALSDEEIKELYTDMYLIRLMELHLEKEYKDKKIRGFCHLVVGQEGLYAVLKKVMDNDLLISSYRCHGPAYAAGISIREIVSECLGTKEGNCKGKGGSMHLYNKFFFGGHGIVGAQVPLGAGLAFALKYKKHQQNKSLDLTDKEFYSRSRKDFIASPSDSICFAIYGDGASNQGQVYESFNMAKVYNLPMVFIVENNKFGMYTPIENVSVDDCFYKRGYKIPGIRVRDTKIQDLYSCLIFTKQYAKVNGPIILQVDTYRKCGHSTLDKLQYYKSQREEKCEIELDSLNYLESLIPEEAVRLIKDNTEKIFQTEMLKIDTSNVADEKTLYEDVFY